MSPVVPGDAAGVARAARALAAGELVAFPTETVYGLGARAADPAAVARVFAAKGRPADHPLIVHLPAAAQLPDWAAPVPEEAWALARAFWPGPLTLVLRRRAWVPDEVTGGQATVGLRVPAHPVARALLAALGEGVAAPSANRFGRLSPTLAEHAEREVGDRTALVLDGGPSEVGVESTIVDLSAVAPRLLRPGGVSRAAVEATLGRALEAPGNPEAPRHSGGLPSHYAPGTPLRLVPSAQAAAAPADVAVLTRTVEAGAPGRRLPADVRGYARGLYRALWDLDAAGASAIWVEAPPTEPAWAAVRDRLTRAAEAGRDAKDAPGR